MAGLAEMIGMPQVSKAIDPRRNMLLGLAAGLVGGPTWGQGLSNGFQLAAQGGALDQQAAEKAKAELKVQSQTDAFKSWLSTKRPDLVPLLDAGVSPSELFNKALAPMDQGPEPTANMRDFQFAQENPGYAEFLNPPKEEAMPAGVQEYQFAQGQGYAGTYADFQKEMKAAGRPAMNATTQKELFEADDAAKAGDYVLSALDEAQKLNDAAYDGPMADVRGDTTALFGDQSGIATSRLKNVTTELALSQLKTIFGSMPTEGERKILLELQGSVNQPKQVRAAIFKRAKEMAQRRIADNQAKASALRSGEYFDPGYSGQQGGGEWTVLGVE